MEWSPLANLLSEEVAAKLHFGATPVKSAAQETEAKGRSAAGAASPPAVPVSVPAFWPPSAPQPTTSETSTTSAVTAGASSPGQSSAVPPRQESSTPASVESLRFAAGTAGAAGPFVFGAATAGDDKAVRVRRGSASRIKPGKPSASPVHAQGSRSPGAAALSEAAGASALATRSISVATDTSAFSAATETSAFSAATDTGAPAAAWPAHPTRAPSKTAKTAEKLRREGNAAFGQRRWSEAQAIYSQAVDLILSEPGDPSLQPVVASLLANRAATWLSLGQPHNAVKDCHLGLKVRRWPVVMGEHGGFKRRMRARLQLNGRV